MNPTQERLLRLLSYSPAQAESFPGDWTGGDWQAVVAEADRHGLVPLLQHRLQRCFSAELIPPPANGFLRRGHRACAVKNFLRFRALAPALAGLAQAGIPVIVLKGAYLAVMVYENMSLRPMSDVDLLLHPEDMLRADPILAQAGFQRQELAATPAQGLNEFHYRQRSGKVQLEAHWELYAPDYPFRFDLEAMWRTAVPVKIAGAEARAFAPEDQLIHLASHAAIHRFEFGLRSLVDLAEVVARLRIDWPLLVEKAGQQSVGRAVAVPLALARELLHVEVPAATIAELGGAALPAVLFSEARETVLLNARAKREQGEPNPNLVLFFGRRSWKARLGLVRSRLFPPRRILATMYPVAADSPLIWFCYPRQFFSILGRNLRGLRTLLRKKIGRSADLSRAGELMDWLLQ